MAAKLNKKTLLLFCAEDSFCPEAWLAIGWMRFVYDLGAIRAYFFGSLQLMYWYGT
jgi:hypothetical protein